MFDFQRYKAFSRVVGTALLGIAVVAVTQCLQVDETYRMQYPLATSIVMFTMAIPSLGFALLPISDDDKEPDFLSKGVSLVHYYAMGFGQTVAILGLFFMFLYLVPSAALAFFIVGGVPWLLIPLYLLDNNPLRIRLIFFVMFLIAYAIFFVIAFV